MSTKIHNKYEARLDNWKNKAKERGAELRSKTKRIKELEQSRDLHKSKWHKERLLRKEDKASLEQLQKEVIKLKYHSYDLESVSICLALKHSENMSLRSCRSMLVTMLSLIHI